MLLFKKKKQQNKAKPSTGKPMSSTDFAIFNTVSGGQRSSYGERGEMCSGAMNNNQKLATLQMLRDFRD